MTSLAASRLPHPRENVCMTVNEDGSLYAVGSQSNVTFVDPRVLKICGTRSILCKQRGCGIRSLSFKNDLLTIGTGEMIHHLFFFWGGPWGCVKCAKWAKKSFFWKMSKNDGKIMKKKEKVPDFLLAMSKTILHSQHLIRKKWKNSMGLPMRVHKWGQNGQKWQRRQLCLKI